MSIGNLKDSGNQGNNFPWQLKMLQGLQAIHDDVSQPLTCAEDSVSICADGDTLTSTTIGADTGLDVNIIGGVTLEVNLDAADDQVGIYGYVNGAAGSPVPLNVNATGQVAINDGNNSITVDAVNLDIRNLVFATDKVDVSNSVISIAAAQFTKTVTPNLIVTAGTAGVISDVVYSISFASNGTGPATISVDGGLTSQLIPAGTTINLDAGGLNWSYAANKFTWNTTAVGASLIITYNS
jgi:hypothetical protein